MLSPSQLLLLFAAGTLAGALNVVAGGGSFLTLPLLIFLGLPATMANGTNRIAILLQNVGAVWGFRRHRLVPKGWTRAATLPGVAGAGLGASLALVTPNESFERILAVLMVVLTLWTLLAPHRAEPSDSPTRPPRWFPWAFFLVGIYGGFVQAGVGFLSLAATTAAGLDLKRGNALKVATILAFSALALTIFAWRGQVSWAPGLALAAGTVGGGQLGVHLTVSRGDRWLHWVVTATVVAFAVKLWWR